MKQIETRYQYWSKDGIVWTEWFKDYSKFETEEEAKENIKRLKELSPKQKLKHEYRVVDYIEPPKVKHVDPLGLYIGGLKKIKKLKTNQNKI